MISSPGVTITVETWERLHAQRIELDRLKQENLELKHKVMTLELNKQVTENILEALTGR